MAKKEKEFELLERKYAEREKAISKGLVIIRKQIDGLKDKERQEQRSKLEDKEIWMEAENRVYTKKLERVEALRLLLLVAKQDNNSRLADTQQKYFLLKKALYEDSMFANKAYITGGTVKHVVGNKQALSIQSKYPHKKGKTIKREQIIKSIQKFNNKDVNSNTKSQQLKKILQ